ncbi:MAG: peptidoglycan DD-metalloendopeptidase family protein [Sphingomonadaceae bacterium]|nr:peptidoglycan DD-metalloendopeptidase family protein [Sphingomonadaceae bacterium]MCP5383679.1 peptidoglycan DD-metalloendopeptidase family protein [Altererythrobacter sp.]MCP5392033.1 peptidoglycan DD-metalloendopeptidase family protein [Sphingomonadaceae bacterium]MCP5394988.1 peptidoglycan DD-metalloendopeptidase family protein [Sphingomonadaceae bacterium]
MDGKNKFVVGAALFIAIGASALLQSDEARGLQAGAFESCGYGSRTQWRGAPHQGTITQNYGVPWSEDCAAKVHTGVDIDGTFGDPVVAVEGGTATIVSLGARWGDAVVVTSPNGMARAYLHVVPSVRPNQTVAKGQQIAVLYDIVPKRSGQGDHLHYNVCSSSTICHNGAALRANFPGAFVDPQTGASSAATTTLRRPSFATRTQTATRLVPPVGLAPGSRGALGEQLASGNVRLRWRAVAGATYYDFGVRDLSTNRLVIDDNSTSTSHSVSLQEGRNYRWNIRACNESGCSQFSAPQFFSVKAAPPRPRPMPTATRTPIPRVTPPARPTATPSPRATTTPAAPARLAVPAVPRDISPGRSSSPGETVSGSRVRLRWSAVAGATEYDLGVRDMTTNRLVVDQKTSSNSLRASLSEGRTYRWNVRACNSAGCSQFTPVAYFNVARQQATPAPTPSPSSSASSGSATRSGSGSSSGSGTTSRSASSRPSMPGGLSPGYSASPGQRMRGTTIRISWDSVRGADYYDYGIRDMTTNKLVVDRQSDRTSYTTRLESGHTYRWNVRACNSAGCSSFTNVRYFTIE